MHVSQLAGNNLHVMSGPRRQPTCWAAPWRSSPLPSSSTRPRAPCPEPAPFGSLLTKTAQQMQVLHRPHLPPYFFFFILHSPSSPYLFFFVTLTLFTHPHRYAAAHHLRRKMCAREKVKLILVMNTTALQWLLTDRYT